MQQDTQRLEYRPPGPRARRLGWLWLVAGLVIIGATIWFLRELETVEARTQGRYTAEVFLGRTGAALIRPTIIVLSIVWCGLLSGLVWRFWPNRNAA